MIETFQAPGRSVRGLIAEGKGTVPAGGGGAETFFLGEAIL